MSRTSTPRSSAAEGPADGLGPTDGHGRPAASRELSGVVDPDAVLAALDPEQREVAAHPTGPMCVIAGAGTGKTRAVTHRIAYGVRSGVLVPNRVLAVTFTARAAGEMRTRLRTLGVHGVQARTFHSAALRQLQFFWPRAVGGSAPDLISVKAPLVAEVGSRLRLGFDRAKVRDVAAEIEWAKVSGVTPETYASARQAAGRVGPGLDATTMARVLSAYEDAKAARHVIDFEDVLLLMVGMLRDRPDIAEEVRRQYRHFVVDEYQDVNAVQQRLLRLWVGDRDDLCVVGDPAQTIYSFTGADAGHLLTFTDEFPHARTVRLVRNYRSSPQIVALANAVSAPVTPGRVGSGRAQGTTDAARAAGGDTRRNGVAADSERELPARLTLLAQGEAGPRPTLTRYADDDAEAAAVATEISARLGRGADPAEMAILFRTNAQSAALESALAAAGVPYLVRGGERFFQREEVRSALVLLRGAARSDDGSTPLGQLARDVMTGAGWSVERPEAAAQRERRDALEAIGVIADDLARSDPEARIRQLVAELDERAAAQHAPTVAGVTLASLHAAKGLEWDVVHIVGFSEGLLPISMATTAEQVQEERRLAYVGVTRARRELRLSWAAARTGGRPTRIPSRFLAIATGALAPGAERQFEDADNRGGSGGAGGSGSSGGAGRGRGARSGSERRRSLPPMCRVCGSMLGTAAERKVGRCAVCPATYDEATFEALRTWRSETAKRDKVPAFVVFTDATLTAIAERNPTTAAQLTTISGVGPRKLELYGEAVLAVLAEHR